MSGAPLKNLDEQVWQKTDTARFWIKPAFRNEKGLETTLMKMDAGAFVGSHTHDKFEQIYVLSGSFYDDDAEYVAGDFLVREAGSPHSAASRDGATMMLIYSPV